MGGSFILRQIPLGLGQHRSGIDPPQGGRAGRFRRQGLSLLLPQQLLQLPDRIGRQLPGQTAPQGFLLLQQVGQNLAGSFLRFFYGSACGDCFF